jgi:hypothetical protein
MKNNWMNEIEDNDDVEMYNGLVNMSDEES